MVGQGGRGLCCRKCLGSLVSAKGLKDSGEDLWKHLVDKLSRRGCCGKSLGSVALNEGVARWSGCSECRRRASFDVGGDGNIAVTADRTNISSSLLSREFHGRQLFSSFLQIHSNFNSVATIQLSSIHSTATFFSSNQHDYNTQITRRGKMSQELSVVPIPRAFRITPSTQLSPKFVTYADDVIRQAISDNCPYARLEQFCSVLLDSPEHASYVLHTFDVVRERGRPRTRQLQQLCDCLEAERKEVLRCRAQHNEQRRRWWQRLTLTVGRIFSVG